MIIAPTVLIMMRLSLKKMGQKWIAIHMPSIRTPVFGIVITNFAGPMNNFFILSIVVHSLAFMRGGAIDYYITMFRYLSDGALGHVGVKSTVQYPSSQRYG